MSSVTVQQQVRISLGRTRASGHSRYATLPDRSLTRQEPHSRCGMVFDCVASTLQSFEQGFAFLQGEAGAVGGDLGHGV